MLTPQQLTTLKQWVVTNASGIFEQSTADLLNVIASPAYWVWRSSLGLHELTDEPDVDTDGTTPTTFVWGGSTGGYINRSQGERDAFNMLFNSVLTCKPHLANVRAAFVDIFSGAGAGAVANRKQCWSRAQRTAAVAEKIFAVQTIGGPTQTGNRGAKTNPDTMGFEGLITLQDLIQADSQG